MAEQTTTSKQRERQGVVVSDKMDKTIVVQVIHGPAPCGVQEGRPPHQPVEGARREQRSPHR